MPGSNARSVRGHVLAVDDCEAMLQVVRASLRRPDADLPRYEDVRTAVLTFDLESR